MTTGTLQTDHYYQSAFIEQLLLNFHSKSIFGNLCSTGLGFPACFHERQMVSVDRKLFHKALSLDDKLWNGLSKIISLEKRSLTV